MVNPSFLYKGLERCLDFSLDWLSLILMREWLLKPFIAVCGGFKKVFVFTFFYLPLGVVLTGAGLAAHILVTYLLFVGFIVFLAFALGSLYVFEAIVNPDNPYIHNKPVLLAFIEWVTMVLAIAVRFLIPTDKGKELHDYLLKKAPYEIYTWIKTIKAEIFPFGASPEALVPVLYDRLYFWYLKLKIFLSTLF